MADSASAPHEAAEKKTRKTANSGRPRKRRSKSRVGSWITSFSGLLASLATIVAAVASIVAAHQTSRVNQLTITVRQQRQQLQTASAKAAAQSPAPPSGASGGAALTGGTYLSNLQPTLDYGELQAGAQTMSSVAYPDSVTFSCDGPSGAGQPDEAFDVAGHTLFRAVVGIPDNAQDATGLDETVTFADQSGTQLMKPIAVSLGNPATVRLNISGVTQLEVTCSGADAQTQQQRNGNQLTLGNAAITR